MLKLTRLKTSFSPEGSRNQPHSIGLSHFLPGRHHGIPLLPILNSVNISCQLLICVDMTVSLSLKNRNRKTIFSLYYKINTVVPFSKAWVTILSYCPKEFCCTTTAVVELHHREHSVARLTGLEATAGPVALSLVCYVTDSQRTGLFALALPSLKNGLLCLLTVAVCALR